jgi:ribosomal protein L30/L7E
VLLVVRLRSGQHEKPKTRGALRALGLREGRWANVLPDDPDVWGSIHRIPPDHISVQGFVWGSPKGGEILRKHSAHLPFRLKTDSTPSDEAVLNRSSPSSAEGYLPPSAPKISSGDTSGDSKHGGFSTVTTQYKAGRTGKGTRFSIGEQMAVKVEIYSDRCTVVWPTDLGANEFIEESRQEIHIGSAVMSVLLRGDRELREIDPTMLEDEAKSAGRNLQIARLTDPELGLSLGWQRSRRSSMATEGTLSAVDSERVIKVIGPLFLHTGTFEVMERTGDLLDEINSALKH